MSAFEVFVLPALFAVVVLMFGYWALLTYRPNRLSRLESASKRAQANRDSGLAAGRQGTSQMRSNGPPRSRS